MIFPRAYLCQISRSWKYDSNSVLRPILSLRVLTLALMFTLMHSHTAHLSDKLQIFLKLQNFLKNFRPKHLETKSKFFKKFRFLSRSSWNYRFLQKLKILVRKTPKNIENFQISVQNTLKKIQNFSKKFRFLSRTSWKYRFSQKIEILVRKTQISVQIFQKISIIQIFFQNRITWTTKL